MQCRLCEARGYCSLGETLCDIEDLSASFLKLRFIVGWGEFSLAMRVDNTVQCCSLGGTLSDNEDRSTGFLKPKFVSG